MQAYEGITYTEDTFTPVIKEEIMAHSDNPMLVYVGCKQLAEIETLKFAKVSPGVKLATSK
jgi:hypothetical protein